VVVQGVQGRYGSEVKRLLREEDLYIGFDENISIPAALNLGISKTDEPFISLFSNDLFAHKDWLQPLLKVLNEGMYHFISPYWRWAKYEELVGWNTYSRPTNSFRALGLNGTTFTRKVFDTIGKFDERFTRIFMDMDYALRINDAGLKMGYADESRCTAMNEVTINYREDEDKEMAKFWCDEAVQKEAVIWKEKWGDRVA
jgi:GT2 family glycosyltransferase